MKTPLPVRVEREINEALDYISSKAFTKTDHVESALLNYKPVQDAMFESQIKCLAKTKG